MRRAAILLFTLALGCADTTGGALIKFPFSVGGLARSAAGPFTFTTLQGWTVTLTQAQITLGPFYFNINPPTPIAFRNGRVIVQVTNQVTVDVLDPTLHAVPGGADGETGLAVAVEIDLLGPNPTASLQNVGVVQGTATRNGVTVPFAGNISIDISVANTQNPPEGLERVNGAVTNLDFAAQTQSMQLRVDPSVWFDSDQCDFSALLANPPVAGNYAWDGVDCSKTPAACSFRGGLEKGIKQLTGVYSFQVF